MGHFPLATETTEKGHLLQKPILSTGESTVAALTCPTEVGPIEEMRKLLGIRESPREIRLIGLSKRLPGAKLQMWLGLADF